MTETSRQSIYDLELPRLNGKLESMSVYSGKVVLAVNVASRCGFTPQYAGLQALQDASPPDQPKIDDLSNQLIWETRIFEDRRRVIGFVCEVPTAIDQRLFALGRVIQQEME